MLNIIGIPLYNIYLCKKLIVSKYALGSLNQRVIALMGFHMR